MRFIKKPLIPDVIKNIKKKDFGKINCDGKNTKHLIIAGSISVVY